MSIGISSTLPPIDQAAIPAEVRNGSPADKKDYQAALGFERMLVDQMTKTMTATAQPVDGSSSDDSGSGDSTDSTDSTGSSSSGDAATSMYLDMLPGQLADSIISSGGTGLAKTFYDSLKEQR